MELGKSIMNEIVTSILLEGKKTLDLLQGLLVFTAWNHLQFPVNPQMTNLSCLAQALINTLHLDREPSSLDHRKMFMESNVSPTHMEYTPTHRSLPEVRSFLGCIYLTSVKGMMGSMSIEVSSPIHSSYVGDCCTQLEQTPEVHNDVLLAQLVRLQLIVENIKHVFPRDRPKKDITAPIEIILKPLELELARFKRSMPPEIMENPVLLMHYHATEVYLYEIGLSDTLVQTSGFGDTQRVEILSRCVDAVRCYFDIYHGLPTSHYAYLPFTIWIQSGLVLLTATKLALFEHCAWNALHARNALRITNIIDHEIGLIEGVIRKHRTGTHERDKTRDIFSGFLSRVQKLKLAYDLGVANGPNSLGLVDFGFDKQMMMTMSYEFDGADSFEDFSGFLAGS